MAHAMIYPEGVSLQVLEASRIRTRRSIVASRTYKRKCV